MKQTRQHIDVWEDCLSIIRDNIPEESFKTWFEPIEALSLEGSTLSIKVPSDFFREYIEEHYIDLIGKTLKRVMGKDARLLYNIAISNSTIKLPQHEKVDLENRLKDPYSQNSFISPFVIPGLQQMKIDSRLNPNYSFENFVEGECNKLGYTAGLAIAKKPGGTPFNPLFIYGGSGLGKTHLAQAIGIAIKEKYPEVELLMGTSTAGIAHAAICGHLTGLPMGYVRSGSKDHGRNNKIEGKLVGGEKTVVIEDLISTGGSVIEVVETLREAGAEVLGVVSIMTYGMKKAQENFEAAQTKYFSLTDFDAVCEAAAEKGIIKQSSIDALKKFRDDPSDESWIGNT